MLQVITEQQCRVHHHLPQYHRPGGINWYGGMVPYLPLPYQSDRNAIKMRTSIYHNLPVFFTFFLHKEVAIYLGDLHAGQVTIVTLEEVTNTTSSNLPGIPDCSRG